MADNTTGTTGTKTAAPGHRQPGQPPPKPRFGVGALGRVAEITGKRPIFYHCDLLDGNTVHKIFAKHKIDFVIHFAAMKAVGESMQFPLIYYKNNVIGTINLIEKWNIIALRYFNPVGAHPSGRLGEDPTKAFTNLMPYIGQVAIGKKPNLTIFGSDYNTPDGTGVRDYIHVMDLASGHVAALTKLYLEHLKFKTYNLGTGEGVSVLQLVKTFESVTNTTITYNLQPRREGDIVAMYANTQLANIQLKWTHKYNLKMMCEDFWRWQTMNPNGYRTIVVYYPTVRAAKPAISVHQNVCSNPE
ncbi:hypothetical protein Pmani_019392 [Petrolisthes manimaculis]|uniref:NAD(P)-binding domain-containing protein n=1 Tax=Petrolisthes manimaculis TaxID=1843537 RepID=A0AAE1PIJ4_9EUCA|nr:hypothetical protein Pmani_019392 [Petrolisthes manimaculis]